MSKSNENNPQTHMIYLGALAADKTVPLFYFPKRSKILSAKILNGATIAASDTDFTDLRLKSGSTDVAELDTRAAHENGITANTAKAMNLVAAQQIVEKDTVLTAVYNETDGGANVALTDAVLALTFFPL